MPVSSPSSLFQIGLEYISNHLQECFDCFTISKGAVKLPGPIGEQLIEVVGKAGKFKEDTLVIICTNSTDIRRIILRNSTKLNKESLKLLQNHPINEFEATHLNPCYDSPLTADDIIHCLKEPHDLKILNLSNNFLFENIQTLNLLCNLQVLNVSSTNFKNEDLVHLAEHCNGLVKLDISYTPVNNISPLLKWKDYLQILVVQRHFEVPQQFYNDQSLGVLIALAELKYVDLAYSWHIDDDIVSSSERRRMLSMSIQFCHQLLAQVDFFSNLEHLDISGLDPYSSLGDLIRQFIRSHLSLKFIGLVGLMVSSDPIFMDPTDTDYRKNLKVAGCSSRDQIIECLARYSHSQFWSDKSLMFIFMIMQSGTDPPLKIDEIRLILTSLAGNTAFALNWYQINAILTTFNFSNHFYYFLFLKQV